MGNQKLYYPRNFSDGEGIVTNNHFGKRIRLKKGGGGQPVLISRKAR